MNLNVKECKAMVYHLAVDIGASSGRHILGWLENGELKLEEIHRFDNGLHEEDGHLCWDLDHLFREIKAGLKKCREQGKIPATMGIDTWGVDFVLLDEKGERIGPSVGYRDPRTDHIAEKIYRDVISEEELYERTGIQYAKFNTIFQLYAIKEQNPEYLERAKDILMLPDYFIYRLTGKKFNEYTEATTGSLVSLKTKNWDYELIARLGIDPMIFRDLSVPGTVAGGFCEEVRNEVGFDLDVVLAPSHDTASAVAAVPSTDENVMYISSGTWSLMGIETKTPFNDENCRRFNITNEGGVEYRYRFLKNIMGLWMIQSVRHETGDAYSFGELCDMAEKADIDSLVDVQNDRFLAPENMTEEIKKACAEQGDKVPETVGEVASVIYRSLAACYAKCAHDIEQITGVDYKTINIIGGGSNAGYLNELTARASGKTVIAGVGEATAVGNIAMQMISKGEIKDLTASRKIIAESFSVKKYEA